MNLEGHDEEYNLDYNIEYTGMEAGNGVPQMKYRCTYTRGGATCVFDFHMGWGHLNISKFKTDMRVPQSEQALIHTLQRKSYARFKDTALFTQALDRQQRLFSKVFPRPLQPLACYCGDAVSALGVTFEDWCPDLGFDTDSRNARKIYDICIEAYAKLRAILTHEEIEELGQ